MKTKALWLKVFLRGSSVPFFILNDPSSTLVGRSAEQFPPESQQPTLWET